MGSPRRDSPTDRASTIYLHPGDSIRARALAQQRQISFSQFLRDVLRDALDRIDGGVDAEIDGAQIGTKDLAIKISRRLDEAAKLVQDHSSLLRIPEHISKDFAFRCTTLADHIGHGAGVSRDRFFPATVVDDIETDVAAPTAEEDELDAFVDRLVAGAHTL